MPEKYDLIIRRAQLRRTPAGQWMDIAIADGVIAAIAPHVDGIAAQELDAAGGLVTESFVNTHLHLCKVYTLQMMDEEALKDYHGADMGKAMTAIELAARVKEKYDERWIIENVRRALVDAARYGNTHIRAFADVDSKARLEGVKALIRAREEFRGIVDIQVVAFAQDGMVREPGARELMHQAMELGADVAGGIPWIEYTEEDMRQHVREIFDLAVEFNKDVSMLVDDAGDPGLRSIEMMALETIRRGWQGRSLAHHARAMSMYPTPYFQKLAALLKKAGMGVVSDPHTGPLHARVRELLAEGCLVCLGQDDISDAYYPYGRNNMPEVAFLASHLLWFTTASDMEILYDMVTVNAARAIGLKNFALKVGSPAHLVVMEQKNVLEVLRYHEAPRYVISHGKLVDQQAVRNMAGL
ncbi:amidohydrolase family protein [Anaerolinea thermophila]|uniref:amidohydrolase family protein n=2 Tax=Anaerolinea TaxID=233189 RepID=UPI0026F0A3C2|nr:amidohydrolase family protein [Anaerolinea thermophila]